MSSNLYVSINIREHISGFDKLKFGYNEKIPSAPKTTLYNVSGLSCVQLSLRKCHEIRQSLHVKDNLKLLLMVNSWSSSESQNLSHISVIFPLTCAILNLDIQMLFSLPPLTCNNRNLAIKMLYISLLHVPMNTQPYTCCISSSYLWHSKPSHTNVVYPPLTCGTLNLAIQMLYIFPLTCGTLNLAIHMLYILLLPVAI